MAQTITLSASSDYGQSGQYICRITGRAERVQFDRNFCGTRSGKRNDFTSYETDEIGLYETQSCTHKGKKRNYYLVLPWRDGIKKLVTDHEDALIIAKRLDGGEILTEVVGCELGDPLTNSDGTPKLAEDDQRPLFALVYTIRSKQEAKQAIAAATLDTAITQAFAALQALPAPLQRKAMAALKSKLFPKEENPAIVA